MAKGINQQELLLQLRQEVTSILDTVNGFSAYGETKLNTPPAAGKWSIAQVVEHLNTYSRYYIPLIAKSVKQARAATGNTFTPGWLGNYFVRSMYSEVKTSKNVANKMSAMKGHIPPPSLNAAATLKEFTEAQQQLLHLLDAMMNVDMSSTRIPITISRLIKISFGDALRFLVAHQVRHQLQMQQVANTILA
jgi:uncharacterized damage-inducible protein DinB